MKPSARDTPCGEDLPGMLAVAKGISEQRWPHTMDAAKWAAEFVKLNPGSDEGLMLSWFANAIMAGYDTAMARAATRPAISGQSLCKRCASPAELAHFMAGLFAKCHELEFNGQTLEKMLDVEGYLRDQAALACAPSHALQNRLERPSTEALPPLGAPSQQAVQYAQSFVEAEDADRNDIKDLRVSFVMREVARCAPSTIAPSIEAIAQKLDRMEEHTIARELRFAASAIARKPDDTLDFLRDDRFTGAYIEKFVNEWAEQQAASKETAFTEDDILCLLDFSVALVGDLTGVEFELFCVQALGPNNSPDGGKQT